HARPARPRHAPAPGRRGARPAPDTPPHHLRRLVVGGVAAQPAGLLQGTYHRQRRCIARVAHPVRRLRGVAAALATGGGAGGAARLLAGPARRGPADARPPRRPPAPSRPELSRGLLSL